MLAAKRAVSQIKRKISAGDGDPEELQLALTNAKRMEMVAKLAVSLPYQRILLTMAVLELLLKLCILWIMQISKNTSLTGQESGA